MTKFKVGIIGFGFVGDALHFGLNHFGLSNIKIYDPYKIPKSTINDVIDCDINFVCVPTPMRKNGCFDVRIITSVLDQLNNNNYKGLIVIKSTVLPVCIRELINKYNNLNISTNPEFLTERCAREDFINSQWIIIGGDVNKVQPLVELYKEIMPDVPLAIVTPEGAMMVKYMTNVWFAVKVSLMNEYHELWHKMLKGHMVNGNWDDIVNAFGLDTRVGKTHLRVPGPDGDKGWGGKCLVGEEIVYAILNDQDKINGGYPEIYNFRDLYELAEYNEIKIASYNQKINKVEFKPIEGIRRRVVDQVLKIKTNKGFIITSSFDHNHLVYNLETKSFDKVKAEDLKVGDYLASINTPINRGNYICSIRLLPWNKVKWVKINRDVSEEEINFLFNNKIISKDQKIRLLYGDKSIISKNIFNALNCNEYDVLKVKTNTHSEFDENIIIDEDYAKLIGYYLAEGNITIDNRGSLITYFSFGFHEKEYISDLCSILKRKGFRYHNRIDSYGDHSSVNVVIVKNSVLGYILTKLGCGKNSKEKKIPESIFNNKELIRCCLSTYFRGDGSVKNGHGKYLGFNMASQSKILIEQINSVFRNIGVIASYVQKRGKKSTGISHQLNINRKEDIVILNNYLYLINDEHKFVKHKLNNIKNSGSGYTNYIKMDNFILVRVVNIELIDEITEVFSTQVKDNENFITSGNLLTANCFPKDLNALVNLAKYLETHSAVMKAAWADNLDFRSNKDWLSIDGAVSD